MVNYAPVDTNPRLRRLKSRKCGDAEENVYLYNQQF